MGKQHTLFVAVAVSLCLNFIACSAEDKNTGPLYLYNAGDALEHVVSRVKNDPELTKIDDGYERAISFTSPLLGRRNRYLIVRLSTTAEHKFDVYKLWCLSLLQEGTRIIEQNHETSRLLSEKDSSWIDWLPFINHHRDEINNILMKLVSSEESLKNYTADVHEFIAVYSATYIGEKSDDIIPISSRLEEAHDSYNRAFDLATVKLREASNDQVSATNILLSIVAIIVSVCAIRRQQKK